MITVVGNLKGGSGKSTVAFNLAVWLATKDRKVIAVDLDPQRTLTDVSDVRDEEGYMPTFVLFGDTSPLADSSAADFIVDVGVSDIGAMKHALSVADRIVIPVAPSQADIWSTQRFLGIVNNSIDDKRPEVDVFVNRADTHHAVRESDEAEEALSSLDGANLIDCRLHQRTAYRRSFSEGLGVFELEPSSKAASEFLDFAQILFPNY